MKQGWMELGGYEIYLNISYTSNIYHRKECFRSPFC